MFEQVQLTPASAGALTSHMLRFASSPTRISVGRRNLGMHIVRVELRLDEPGRNEGSSASRATEGWR